MTMTKVDYDYDRDKNCAKTLSVSEDPVFL